MERFNERLRELRAHKKLTQAEFGEKLNVTQANVSQLENGECLPTGETISRIYRAFPEVDWNWLVKPDYDGSMLDQRSRLHERIQNYETAASIHVDIIENLRKENRILFQVIDKGILKN